MFRKIKFCLPHEIFTTLNRFFIQPWRSTFLWAAVIFIFPLFFLGSCKDYKHKKSPDTTWRPKSKKQNLIKKPKKKKR